MIEISDEVKALIPRAYEVFASLPGSYVIPKEERKAPFLVVMRKLGMGVLDASPARQAVTKLLNSGAVTIDTKSGSVHVESADIRPEGVVIVTSGVRTAHVSRQPVRRGVTPKQVLQGLEPETREIDSDLRDRIGRAVARIGPASQETRVQRLLELILDISEELSRDRRHVRECRTDILHRLALVERDVEGLIGD